MHILLIALGSRGDVQPAIAIGKALKNKGHQVSLFSSITFEKWIKDHDLDFYPCSLNAQAMMQEGEGQDWAEYGCNPIFQARLMRKMIDRDGLKLVKELWPACQGKDLLIGSFTSNTYLGSIAEKLQIKHISLMFQPSFIATQDGRVLPKAILPNRISFLNYLFSKFLMEPGYWYLYGGLVNQVRRELLGLPAVNEKQYLRNAKRTLTLHTYSKKVVPQASDWPPNFHTTGYCFLDEDNQWQPPKELEEFLNTSEPVISIGFGSMSGRNQGKFSKQILDAVEKLGCKVVLLSGWGQIKNTRQTKQVFEINSIPHQWIFPRVKAVVHHGGAGTTAASLRAGRPTVIIPHLGDQPFWGERVSKLGLGPKPIIRPQLTTEKLVNAIQIAIADIQMQQRTEAFAKELEQEEGLKQTVNLIEDFC